MTCTQSMTGSLADFLDPGDELPPGADPTDTIDVTFTVTAVHVG